MAKVFPCRGLNVPDEPVPLADGCALPCVRNAFRALLAFAVVLSADVVVSASWESWLGPQIYGVSFDQYGEGDPLSNLGSDNGVWDAPIVPDGANVHAEIQGDKHYMVCSIPGEGDYRGIVFKPNSTGDRGQKSVVSSIWLAKYAVLPDLGDDVRAAFTIHAPKIGTPSFVGWGRLDASGECGWQKLVSGSLSPEAGWYSVSLRFRRDAAGTVYVQYRLADSSGKQYEPLRLQNSAQTWLVAGGSGASILDTVEFKGNGKLENFTGKEPQRGLAAGVGNWRKTLFDETVFSQDSGNTWSPAKPEKEGEDFAIVEDDKRDVSSTFMPETTTMGEVTVAKFQLCFRDTLEDNLMPTNACAGVRLVTDPKDVCRFAYLIGSTWATNTTVVADASVKYTVEVRLDRKTRQVTYRAKEGYGAEGGANVFLGSGKMDDKASGRVEKVEFYGSGFVREIKGQPGT